MTTTTKKKPARQLYDNGMLVRLRAPGWQGVKTDPRIKAIVCKETGADESAVTGSKIIVPRTLIKEIKSPVEVARFHLKEVAVPWSANKSDLSGNRKEDGFWLVYQKDLPALEVIFRDCRTAREKAIRKFLRMYDDVIAERRVSLGSLFSQDDYPTKNWLKERFSWTVEVKPLWDLADVEKDLRLKLPASWSAEQVQLARLDEAKRIGNAVAAAANEVVTFVTDTTTKLRDYDPDSMTVECSECLFPPHHFPDPNCKKCKGTGVTEDKRKGNTFRDKTLFANVPKLRERIERLNEMLGDDALVDSVKSLTDLEKLLNSTDGKEIRENGKLREKVAEGLDDAAQKAAPATDRIAELMS